MRGLSPKRGAFTLLESLAVIASIRILVALLLARALAAENSSLPSPEGAPQPNQSSVLSHPSALFMLTNKTIQKELGLSEDQKAQITALTGGYVDDTWEAFQRMGRLRQTDPSVPAEARQRLLAEVCKVLNDKSAHYQEAALAVLDSKQQVRLEQLRLQASGVWVLYDARTRQKLGVTDSQWKGIKEAVDKNEALCREVAGQARGNQIEGSDAVLKVRDLRRKVRDQVFSSLTPGQKAKLDELLGRKPDFEPDELRFIIIPKVPGPAAHPRSDSGP